MNYSTGNKIVDNMKSLNITGNVIPMRWYQVFNNKSVDPTSSGKIRLLAINILADIVYWYRPTEIRDEKSGLVIGYKKKFKLDLLQRSYDDLCKMFMCSKKDAQRALKFLEQFGVIKRVFRTLNVSGIIVANVLFLSLDVDILKSLTYPDTNMDEIVHTKKPYSPTKNTILSTTNNECVQTNTDNTPENTTNTTLENTYTTRARAREESEGSVCHVKKENEGFNSIWKRFITLIGIKYRNPSETEKDTIKRWYLDLHFSDDLIRLAYDMCIDKKGEYSIKYMNGILINWFNRGIKTVEDAKTSSKMNSRRHYEDDFKTYDLEAYERFDIFGDD